MFDINNQSEEIKRILDYVSTDNLFISLYLEVDASKITKQDYLSKLNSMIVEKRSEIEKNSSISNLNRKNLNDIFIKIKNYFNDYYRPEFVKTVLLFAGEDDTWVEIKLPVNIKSKIMIDPKPHTQVLRTLINNTTRYGILEIDREKAQIYLMYLGQIQEGFAAFISEVPSQVKYRREGSDREKQQMGRIEVKLNQFFKIINDKLLSLFREGKIDTLILAGIKDIALQFKNYMSSSIQPKYIGYITSDKPFSPQSLKENASKLIKQVETEYKDNIVKKLLEEYIPTEWGVIGAADSIKYLMLDQIKILIYDTDFETPGYVCEKCGYLTIKEEPSCPYCDGRLIHYSDITDEIIEVALNQGCELVEVRENQYLKDSGSIGAILRFKISA
ncbi:MAG: hypothetical protein PHU65_04145 [Actinomycetota bacterium]|nr:hypothetical protein [Actinomycetota bacterium]